jgi:cyclophilin family peptidyl-prolyl cis-trans isomerase
MKHFFSATIVLSLACAGMPWQSSPLVAGESGIKMVVEGKGEIIIKFYGKEAPEASKRILKLAKDGFYDAQTFFKVVKSPRPFLVQFGDPNSKSKPADDPSLGTYASGTKIAYENSGFKHVRGAVGLARLPENRNTGDTQFYIMLDSAPFLDGQYTVFGNVVKGMEVVDKISQGDKVTTVSAIEN